MENKVETKITSALYERLNSLSKEELIDIIVSLARERIISSIFSSNPEAARVNNCIAEQSRQIIEALHNKEGRISPLPDWSKAMFEGAAQSCEIGKSLSNEKQI